MYNWSAFQERIKRLLSTQASGLVNVLDIKFLGTPKVFYGDQSLKFATRKSLALFAYLIVEKGSHPREKLMALFWPESETHLAQSAFRNTLARLKATLKDVVAPLDVEAYQVGFNFSCNYTLDLDLVNHALDNLQGATLAQASSLLHNAVAAARGPFLDGFFLPDAPAFDDWITIQRNACERRLGQIFDRLSRDQMEAHQFSQAIATVASWIKLDRFNETAYRRLMRLHFLNGNRSTALETYEVYRDLLAQELGVEPMPRTSMLLTSIQSSQPVAPITPLPAGFRIPLRVPFIGRAEEHQQLVQIYRRGTLRQAEVAVVVGESGMGKTRLAAEFLSWASTEGADILRGQAFEIIGRLPYQPVIDALRERLECENAPEDLLDDAWLVELTLILPELRERYPDLSPVSEDESTSRARLFEAIVRLTQALAARHPLVCLIDDVHWADTDTLELLHYLARRWHESRTPALLLVLLSQESLAENSDLDDWLVRLSQAAPMTHLALTPVNNADLQQLARSLAGEEAPGVADFSTWLFAESEGRPFIVAETLTALDEYGALVWVNEGTSPPVLNLMETLANLKSLGSITPVPKIRDLIITRLKRLSQPAATLLSAAAVLNRSFTYARLCQISAIDEINGLNALDELLAKRFLLEDCDAVSPYSIAHNRIREIVYTELHQAHQQVYHHRALELLAAMHEPAAELAYHALAAREWQAGFRYSLEAGDEAMRLFAVTPAILHYENALRLLRENMVEAETATTYQRLYARLVEALEGQHRFPEAAALYKEMEFLAAMRNNRGTQP